MYRSGIDDNWIREIHKPLVDTRSNLTFCGALEQIYDYISYNWNETTKKKRDNEINNIILPNIENHNEKTIDEYTAEDLLLVIEKIKKNGYQRSGVFYKYSKNSIENFERLIYDVVFYASEFGQCDNVLWGSKFVLEFEDEKPEIIHRIKKSFTVEQEINFFNSIMLDPYCEGSEVALLLMWGLGLRNSEACGLNYGDIKLLDGYEDCYTAWIYKTTKIGSNELQTGGKTYNTGRIIPIPKGIIRFLRARELMLIDLLKERSENIDINDIPICNVGEMNLENEKITERISSKVVTNKAKIYFEKIGITSNQIAYLDEEISQGDIALELREKEPTAYLLRRNFATQMQILGLSISEIQYIIGHNVEDAYESRNNFVDNERLYHIYLKLNKRALIGEKEMSKKQNILYEKDRPFIKINIDLNEVDDEVKVTVIPSVNNVEIPLSWFKTEKNKTPDREINILKDYYEIYDSKK